eukprot:TRINITY_DN33072_c0_g1_i4.p1 TRINITY_DN33072_c0_g1~~TRINITY_DN33072_c0_g1_i4.p1  ORF type:complete len:393 (+),score=84.50 TRINITY_DN33072_c0_g1_i4:150-1328(+)
MCIRDRKRMEDSAPGPIEDHARARAAAIMRKGREQIQEHHHDLYKQRMVDSAEHRFSRQKSIAELKEVTAQPYQAVQGPEEPARAVLSPRRHPMSQDGYNSDDEEKEWRTVSEHRIEERDRMNDLANAQHFYERLNRHGHLHPPNVPVAPPCPQRPLSPPHLVPAIPVDARLNFEAHESACRLNAAHDNLSSIQSDLQHLRSTAYSHAPVHQVLHPPVHPVVHPIPARSLSPPRFVPLEPVPPPPPVPLPPRTRLVTTDLLGRVVAPEGRTLLVDRRTPEEIALRRQEVQESAGVFITERKAAEEQDWKLREARARQQANEEWEREEAQRRDLLDQQVSDRLLSELQEVEEVKNEVRSKLGLKPTSMARDVLARGSASRTSSSRSRSPQARR